jgi:hypothetical protein
VPLAQPRGRASACRICSIIKLCCRHFGRGSSTSRVLRSRINLSTVDVGPECQGCWRFPSFWLGFVSGYRLGARRQARDPPGRQPRAQLCTAHAEFADAAVTTERPESYPRIVDRGRRTSGVPDPAQPQLGERSVLTRARRGGNTSCLLATSCRRREPELDHRRGEEGLNL